MSTVSTSLLIVRDVVYHVEVSIFPFSSRYIFSVFPFPDGISFPSLQQLSLSSEPAGWIPDHAHTHAVVQSKFTMVIVVGLRLKR